MKDLGQAKLPEWVTFQAAAERARTVAARLAVLVRELPDASEKERPGLLKDQTGLQGESLSLPATVAEAGRRACLAHLAALAAEHDRLSGIVGELGPRVAAFRGKRLGLQKRQRDNLNANVHDKDAFLETGVKLLHECQALDAEGEPVELQYTRALRDRQATIDRAGRLYGAALLNSATWPRAAHFYGAQAGREADRALHGTFDSLVRGPERRRPREPRSAAPPTA